MPPRLTSTPSLRKEADSPSQAAGSIAPKPASCRRRSASSSSPASSILTVAPAASSALAQATPAGPDPITKTMGGRGSLGQQEAGRLIEATGSDEMRRVPLRKRNYFFLAAAFLAGAFLAGAVFLAGGFFLAMGGKLPLVVSQPLVLIGSLQPSRASSNAFMQ